MDLEDLETAIAVRHADLDLAVEPSGTAQRRIERVRAVRCADDDDLPAGLETVHEGEELGDDTSLDLAGDLVPLRRDRVDLVDEDDARRVLFGLLEHVPEVLLALTVELRHDFGARDGMEVRVRLRGDGFREERLPGPGRAVQQHALRGLDAESLEQLRVAERELDHLADLADLLPEPPDVLVVDLRDFRFLLFHRLLGDLDVRRRFHEDRVGPRLERRDDEIELAPHHTHADHVPAGDRAALKDLGHVLLAAHDPDRFGRRERDLLRGAGQRLAQAHLVVDPDARVPALHPVHPNHAAVRVFRIAAADPGRGRLRPFDEDDVPFLQFEDLHDLGVEPHDSTTRIRGLRLGDSKELLTSCGHGRHSSCRAGSHGRSGRAFATNRGYLNSCQNPRGNRKREEWVPSTRRAP